MPLQIGLDYLIEFINQYLQMPTRSGFRWSARCPICGDSAKNIHKKRFGIVYEPQRQDGKAHCFNCGYSAGSLVKLIIDVKQITFTELKKELGGNSLEILEGKKKQQEEVKEIKQNFEDFSWILKDCITDKPDGIVQNKLYQKFLQFKESRKITNFDMYCCYKGEYKSRAIMPIYQNDQMVYFQARTLINSDLKYKNPISPKHNIIYNKDKWDINKPVVITEGLLDAISIGNQGTMCLGASISDEFISKLPENIIISLDNDETGKKSMLKISEKSKYKNKLKFCIYPKSIKCKDLNEILINGYNVYEFVLENSYDNFKAQLILRGM